ncbi:MAG: DJ-1/PfpI family protein [bacterium]|nr:DJ-1/PfpI family protein [bacterium]
MKKYIVFFIVLAISGFVFAENKKILIIIAPSDFRDEEYQKPRELFEKAGVKITVASSSLNISKGMMGLEVKPDILIENVKVNEFDAVIFIGGVGAQGYWDNKTAHKIVQEAIKQNKILGAICLAPVILAKAGVLKDKRATCFGTAKNKITEYGGKYIGSLVEIDGNIITANGPLASETFAKDIIEVISIK